MVPLAGLAAQGARAVRLVRARGRASEAWPQTDGRRKDGDGQREWPRNGIASVEDASHLVRADHREDESRPDDGPGGSELEKGVPADRLGGRDAPEGGAKANSEEIADEDSRPGLGCGTEDETRRSEPQEFRAEHCAPGDREREPDERSHSLPLRSPPTAVPALTRNRTRLATATSAGPSGTSKR
jgi:hypothetical protein